MPAGTKAARRLLMISYPFLPSLTAGAMRSERFARHLGSRGWAVDVVTIKPRRDLYSDVERACALGPNVDVHRTRTWDPWLDLKALSPKFIPLRAARSLLMKVFSFPDHMLLWVPFAVAEGRRLMRSRPFDAIYTTSPPHSTHLAGLWLARATGRPWIADFRDPWTINRYKEMYRGSSGLDKTLLGIEARLERAVLRTARVVLTNTPSNHLNLLACNPWLPPGKVVHLPNAWEPFDATSLPPRSDDRLTIVHAGTFYPGFKPYALLQALAHWRNGHGSDRAAQRVKVDLLGATDATTRNTVADLKLDDIVRIHPWVSVVEARQAMQAADVLWASLGTGPESRTFVPSKLFEYIAAGRPILGFFPEGDAADLIRATGTGRVFTDDRPAPVINALSAMLDLDPGRTPEWYRPNNEIIEGYRIDSIAGRLAEILEGNLARSVEDAHGKLLTVPK